MAAPSSLSMAARALRTQLAGAVGLPEGQIMIGHPSLAVKDIEGETNKQFLNLFFYRIESGAYPSDAQAADVLYLRFYCLITALGTKETATGGATVSAGENDLRLVGAVVKRLHESPLLRLRDDSAQEVAQLQVVLHVLSLDDLNHIWSTQGDTPYRLSVGYELALVPLPLVLPAVRGARVGAIGVSLEGEPAAAQPPEVPAVRVDISRPDWAPHLCWLAADGSLQYSLAFEAGTAPANFQVIALGAPGADVDLQWELWDPAPAEPKWTTAPAAPAQLTPEVDWLDPASGTAFFALAHNVASPISARGQALLCASRAYTRPDGAQITLRSNPLLVSVH